MATVDDLIERFNLAQGEFLTGNVEPMNDLFSHREDVTPNIRLRTGSAGKLVKSMVHARGPRRKRPSGC
jgi:hypothetical protein